MYETSSFFILISPRNPTFLVTYINSDMVRDDVGCDHMYDELYPISKAYHTPLHRGQNSGFVLYANDPSEFL